MGSYKFTIAFSLNRWFISPLKVFEGTKGEGKQEEGASREKGWGKQAKGWAKVCK